MRRFLLPRAALVGAILATAACEAAEVPDTTGGGGDEGRIEFAPVNRSGVTGTVEADHDDDEVTVTVEMAGLQPAAVYPVHIHLGRCAAGGPVAVALGDVTADEDGAGRLTGRAPAGQLDPREPIFVQAHGEDGAAVACADLPGHGADEQPLTERIPADSREELRGDSA